LQFILHKQIYQQIMLISVDYSRFNRAPQKAKSRSLSNSYHKRAFELCVKDRNKKKKQRTNIIIEICIPYHVNTKYLNV